MTRGDAITREPRRRRLSTGLGPIVALLAVLFQSIAPGLHDHEHRDHPTTPVVGTPLAAHDAAAGARSGRAGCSHAHTAHHHDRPAHDADPRPTDDPAPPDHEPCGLCDLIAAARVAVVHATPPPPTSPQRLPTRVTTDPAQRRALAIATPAHPRGPPSLHTSA